MRAVECGFPAASTLPRHMESFDYWDSFKVDLSRGELKIHEIYLGIFAYPPEWLKLLLNIRTKAVSVFGIGGPTAFDLNHVEIKDSYAVGDKIALWPLFSQDDNEIVAGKNDKHLDFRVSVLRLEEEGVSKVVLTTVVKTHNRFGEAYLRLITPFHKFSVKQIMSNASAARRV